MKRNENHRIELVPIRRIKRMPGMKNGGTRKGLRKARDFVKKRGFCNPVVLSDRGGCMTLLSGSTTFEAALKKKKRRYRPSSCKPTAKPMS